MSGQRNAPGTWRSLQGRRSDQNGDANGNRRVPRRNVNLRDLRGNGGRSGQRTPPPVRRNGRDDSRARHRPDDRPSRRERRAAWREEHSRDDRRENRPSRAVRNGGEASRIEEMVRREVTKRLGEEKRMQQIEQCMAVLRGALMPLDGQPGTSGLLSGAERANRW